MDRKQDFVELKIEMSMKKTIVAVSLAAVLLQAWMIVDYLILE